MNLDPPVTAQPQPSISASIVLYKTPISAISTLIAELRRAGVAKIFVVDNSPTGFDKSVDLYGSDLVERICTGRNLGYGRAHNIAIARTGDGYSYHLICNPDIAVPPDTIPLMTEFMESNTEVGLCMPKLVGPDGQLHYCCRRSPLALDYLSQLIMPRSWGLRRRSKLEMRYCNYDQQMEVPCLSGCFMFFRNSVLRRLGGFDERFFLYFEDFDLSLRSTKLARNVYFPRAHVVHERQSAHKKSWRLKAIFAMSAFQYFSKWGWFSTRAGEVTN
jgi:GT2 family glycosyltransferase